MRYGTSSTFPQRIPYQSTRVSSHITTNHLFRQLFPTKSKQSTIHSKNMLRNCSDKGVLCRITCRYIVPFLEGFRPGACSLSPEKTTIALPKNASPIPPTSWVSIEVFEDEFSFSALSLT